MKLLLLPLVIAAASAFAPAALLSPVRSASSSTARSALADEMAGKSIELGGGVWDPLGLSSLGSERTLKWFRASEVKHCRVAMLATMGWAHTCNGWSKIDFGEGVGTLGSDPWKALESTPALGLVQIIVTAGIVEILTETVLGENGEHYMNTKDGHVNPLMFKDVDEKMKNKELKNGR